MFALFYLLVLKHSDSFSSHGISHEVEKKMMCALCVSGIYSLGHQGGCVMLVNVIRQAVKLSLVSLKVYSPLSWWLALVFLFWEKVKHKGQGNLWGSK